MEKVRLIPVNTKKAKINAVKDAQVGGSMKAQGNDTQGQMAGQLKLKAGK